jgi:hypothetical protein
MAKTKVTKSLQIKTKGISKTDPTQVSVDAPSGEGKTMQLRTAMSQKAVLDALRASRGHIGRACEDAGISRETYHTWYKEDPDFKGAVQAIKEHRTDDYEEALDSAAIDGKQIAAIKYYLDNHGQERGYGKELKAQQDAAAKPQVAIQNNVLATLPPDLLRQIAEHLKKS